MVLHGGAAKMTANSPRTILSRSGSYTFSICDVRLVASARLGVVVHEFDFETELPKELGEAVGTIVISGEEEEDLDGQVHSTLGGLGSACESLG